MINYTLLPHPHLYAGIDDWGLALDEINGAGWNDAIWPDAFSATIVSTPMVTAYPLVIDCHDYCVRSEKTTFKVPWERRSVCVGA